MVECFTLDGTCTGDWVLWTDYVYGVSYSKVVLIGKVGR